MESSDKLLKIIKYHFNDSTLLDTALTHRSAATKNNERLEFLGDSVLGLVISTELYQRFSDIDEGVLSRLRATLVKGETLAELAREIGLGDYIQLGSGEFKSGGFRRTSILADAFEAVIGAIYLDGGLKAATTFILQRYHTRLQQVNPEEITKDPKTRLQEYLQARGLPVPVYTVLSIDGESHQQIFTVKGCVDVIDHDIQASGKSRRFAEQQVAEKILELLSNDE